MGPAPARCLHWVWSAGVGSVTCREGQAPGVLARLADSLLGVCCADVGLGYRSANYCLPAWSGCLPASVNTALLEHSHAHWFISCSWPFPRYEGRVENLLTRLYGPGSLKYSLSGPWQVKFTSPALGSSASGNAFVAFPSGVHAERRPREAFTHSEALP